MTRREEALWCALFAAVLVAVCVGPVWVWEVLPCAR